MQFQQEIKDYEEKISKLEEKVNAQHMEVASLQVKLEEKPGMALLEQKLESERNECSRLRSRIIVSIVFLLSSLLGNAGRC